MNGFSGLERAKLSQDLRDEIYDLIHEHGRIAGLTVVEALGVLEILKFQLLIEQGKPDFDGDEE